MGSIYPLASFIYPFWMYHLLICWLSGFPHKDQSPTLLQPQHWACSQHSIEICLNSCMWGGMKYGLMKKRERANCKYRAEANKILPVSAIFPESFLRVLVDGPMLPLWFWKGVNVQSYPLVDTPKYPHYVGLGSYFNWHLNHWAKQPPPPHQLHFRLWTTLG